MSLQLFFLIFFFVCLFIHLFDCLSCHLAWESGWKKTSLRCLLPGRHGPTPGPIRALYIICVTDFGVSYKIHIFVQCPHILWTYFLPHRKANPKDKEWEEKSGVHSNYTDQIHFLGSTATNNIMKFLKFHIYPEKDSWVIKPAQETKWAVTETSRPSPGTYQESGSTLGKWKQIKKYIYSGYLQRPPLKTQEKWQDMLLESQQELIKSWQASERITMCLFQKWSLKVFQKSRILPGKVNIKLQGVKKNRNKKAFFLSSQR